MSDFSRSSCVSGFGEELDELVYEGVSNWFISFRSLFTTYSAHFSYLVVFFSIIACGLLSYRHSTENGKKYTQFWWGALLHGVVSERGITSNRYWHAQAPVMFIGKQLPLHIIFLYPSIVYVAMMAVHKLKLNICTEPAAVGLIAMVMEIPFRMISVKFLHITYHDTDPMYSQKLCGVPWVEILSSLFLATSYVAVYHGAQYYETRDLSTIWDDSPPTSKEGAMTIMCGLTSPIAGFVQKIVLFHLFQDSFNINPISCLFFVISLYLSFIVCFEPKKLEKDEGKDTEGKTFLFYQVLIYLSCILFLAMFGKPQNEFSIGRHEPTGDCTTVISSRSPLGKAVQRQKYLNPKHISSRCNFLYNFECLPHGAPCFNAVWYTICDEVSGRKCFVYNFDCLEEGPPCSQAIWYTICGSPIYNRPQFLMNILSFTLIIWSIFGKTLFTDTEKQLEAAKRLIVRFRSEFRDRFHHQDDSSSRPPPVEPSEGPSGEEVTVGFVLVNNDYHLFPKLTQGLKRKNT